MDARCRGCSALIAVRGGRLAAHERAVAETGSGRSAVPVEPCPASGTVPWRLGIPDEATVRALLQRHPGYGIPVALFQVQCFGMFPGIVGACFVCGCTDVECEPDCTPRMVWRYGFPSDAADCAVGGRIKPGSRWAMRPLDIDLHEPRPWPEVDARAEQ